MKRITALVLLALFASTALAIAPVADLAPAKKWVKP